MSGGYFNNNIIHIRWIYEQLEDVLNRQGILKTMENYEDYDDRFDKDTYFETFPDNIQEYMKNTVKDLKNCYAKAKALDMYLSRDISDVREYEKITLKDL